jgi:hypothetical protein
MFRGLLLAGLIALAPNVAMAQQACTTSDARHVVDELYRHMLERSAGSASQGWVDQLQSGRTNVREVVRQIAQSPESMQRFYNASEGANAYQNAVGNLYRHILGRQPDAAGMANFANMARQANSLAPVVDQLINSAEYTQSFGDWGVPGSGGLVYCGNGAVVSSAAAIAPRYDDYNVNPNSRFAYLDVNNDGYIERNEWDGSLQSFYALDRNNDGRISRDELNRSGRMTSFAALDTNHDGRIELGEWRWSHASFDQMDTNGDGVITQDEFNNGAVSTSGRRY